MSNGNSTNFVRREIEADPLRAFETRVSEINNSVIAFGYGTREDGSPNAIGTGFSVANLNDNAGLFATCLHVMNTIARIRDLSSAQLENEGLVDRRRRIAFLNNGRYEWHEVDPIRFSNKIQIRETNFVQTHDVCICHIPGIQLASLNLSPDEYFMGSELGIVGFPNFEHLQKLSVQPYVIKTILSSHMRYPFELEDGDIVESQRIALDCIVGEGFSGSPVFSVRDGNIIGMVDYLPTESYIEDLKITSPVQTEGNIRVHYAAGISFAVPSTLIQRCLDFALRGNWEDPREQTYTIRRA